MTEATTKWEEIRARVAAAQHAAEQVSHISDDRAQSILRQRAETLAKSAPARAEMPTHAVFVEFILGQERYAIESSFIREILVMKDFTAIPSLPSFVVGVINLRGQIVSIVDLKKVFELPDKGISELNKVIVVTNAVNEFGVLADEISDMRPIDISDIATGLPTLNGTRGRYLRGITQDAVAVLDIEKLLSDDALIIKDEVEV